MAQKNTYIEVCESESQLLHTIWWNSNGVMDDVETSR